MTDLARDTIRRTLEKDQFDLNNSVLDVEAKDLALKFATLTAPFEGVITGIDIPQPGTNITPAGALIDLVNPNTLFFSASADQTEIVNFIVGMNGRVVLDSYPDHELNATITRIGFVPKAGETGTVYELTISVDLGSLQEKIKMGMTGDADFILKERVDVLAVPEKYISKLNDRYYITKVAENNLEKVEVEIGETIDGLTEIISGLNEKDLIYYKP